MAASILTNKLTSSKAAEIYRESNGRIYYLCFRCGYNSDSNTDMLVHIDVHFPSRTDITMEEHLVDPDVLDTIKCELPDEDSLNELEPTQIQQIFIDCGDKPIMKEEKCSPMDSVSGVILPFELSDKFSHLDGLFEWKCLRCDCSFKKSKKLERHLLRHNNDPTLRGTHGLNTEKTKEALYSFKCTLCTSEFYDLISSEKHLQDSHVASHLPCIPCRITFPSAELLKEHMASVHSNAEAETAPKVLPTETNQCECKGMPAKEKYKKTSCLFCDKTFIGTLEFMLHMFGHFNLKIFDCPECSTKFQRIDTRNAHMRKKHSHKLDYKFYCRFCNDKKDHCDLFDLVKHAYENHLDDGDRDNSDCDTAFSYHCRFCSKYFTQWNDAREHLEIHAEDQLTKDTSSEQPISNGRYLTERAKSGAYRSEFLYNCCSCMSTLCGSYEAREHWIQEHGHSGKFATTSFKKQLSDPVHHRLLTSREAPEKRNLKCADCFSSFDWPISLMSHRLTHFNIQPYTCIICSQSFSTRSHVSRHMVAEHAIKESKQQPLICKFCEAEFVEDYHFVTHNFTDHLYENFSLDEDLDENCKYECVYCSEVTTKRDLMDLHLHTHKDEELPGNSSAGTNADSDESSINELRHKAEFLFICKLCPKKFRLPFDASKHAKFAHKVGNHVKPETIDVLKRDTHCSVCNTNFTSWRSLVNHRAQLHPETFIRNPNYKPRKSQTVSKRQRRTPEGNYCNICNMTFLNNRSMINHRTKRHPETVQPSENRATITCMECDKTFRVRSNYIKHRETHEKRHFFTCDICKKTYRLKNSLQTHMLVHTNEKNFVCEECGKSFYTTSKLNLHKQVHENLTIQCDKCDKVFHTRNNFSKHQKTHIDNVRKKCKVCDDTFKSSASLRVHMMLHDDSKKFSCKYCDMTFAQSSGRRGHERTRHGIV